METRFPVNFGKCNLSPNVTELYSRLIELHAVI